MSGNQFVPSAVNSTPAEENTPKPVKNDSVSSFLHKSAQYMVLAAFLLVPVFFTPKLWASLGFDKVLLTLVLSVGVVVSMVLLALRSNKVNTILPVSLGIYWLFVIAAFVSALYNGDVTDSIRGSGFEVQTVGFMALIGLVMTVTMVLQNSKRMTMKAVLLFGTAAAVVVLYNLIRMLAGPDFLSFGTFTNLTISPIGSLNDLALFSGLLIILSLITLVQLPLNTALKSMVAAMVVASLFLLGVVNFFNIWVFVGFFSLLMLVYLLSKNTQVFNNNESDDKTSVVTIAVVAVVCVVSAIFVVAGDYAGGVVNKVASVDYAEVVPSREGTLDIARSVYQENALFGIGPNRFADAWRLHKDQSINLTIFWDTDFNTGSGFVPTTFITSGALAGLILALFHVWFLYLGYKLLVRSDSRDSYWYYIASVSFTATVYIWGTAYMYEPNSTILILGALFAGLTFASASSIAPYMVKSINLVTNQRRGFFVMAVAVVLITNAVIMLLSVGKQYVAQASFNEAQVTSTSADELDLAAANSYGLFADDRFMRTRAQIQLGEINTLLGLTEPTEADRERFLDAVDKAQSYVTSATEKDPTNPDNHALLSGIFGALTAAGVEGASDRTFSSLEKAKEYDPLNPGYDLVGALTAARTGDLALSKEKIESALELKPNFTQALFLLAQLDISAGNSESAIATTQALVSLEPRNPTRYFQLGMLYSANEDYDLAIQTFSRAVLLDPQYANARYMLALALLATGNSDEALNQLKEVQKTNEENVQLNTLITQVESGELDIPELGLDAPVNETIITDDQNNSELGTLSEDTDLVDSLNVVPADDEEDEDVVAEESAEEVVTEEETEE